MKLDFRQRVVHMVDQNIIEYVEKLGVSNEGAKVYMALVGKAAQTAQEIARISHIPKTTIYRRLEELKKQGLVEEQVEEHKRTFTITSIDFFNLLITKKEQEIKDLRAQLPNIRHLLLGQSQSYDPETKVLFYRGREGIQQMLWNVLSATTEIVGYTYRSLTSFTGKSFFESWNKEFLANGLKGRDLSSDEYIVSKFEDESGLTEWGDFSSRYIDPDVLDIQHQMDIYNNVVSTYNWYGEDIFGIEIYNEKVAKFQRQIFEVMWEKGGKMNLEDQKLRYQEFIKKR